MTGRTLYSLFFVKWLAIAAVCWLVFAAFAPVQAQQILSATTSAWLNMRTGPGTGYPVILSIPAGGQVAVYQCTTNRAWCEVGYSGRIGWSSARYLNFAGGGAVSGDPEPQPPPVIGQVQARTTATLNMRSGPSTAYPTIRAIPAGAIVVVNRCTAGYTWCELTYAGSTGWSSARYLTSTSPQYSQQPITNVGELLGLRLFEFILGQIGGGQQPPQPPARGQACFFHDWFYQGATFCLEQGATISFLNPSWNDRISSLRVDPGVTVEVCDDVNFGGRCERYTGDAQQLTGRRNDSMSSIRVR